VDKANEVGFLEGFGVGNSLSISHLLFPNDTLIFCKLDKSSLKYLRCIFLFFEDMYGLRMDF